MCWRIPTRWLAAAAILGAGLALSIAGLVPEPDALPPIARDERVSEWIEVRAEGATPVRMKRDQIEFRAYVPNPMIRTRNLSADVGVGLVILVTNVNQDFVRLEGKFEKFEWLSRSRVLVTLVVTPGGAADVAFVNSRPDAPTRVFVAADPELNFVVLDRFLDRARDERPDFVWILGDFMQERAWPLEFYVRMFEEAEVPVYTVPGNHDLLGDPEFPPWEAKKELFERTFGPLYQAFVFRGVEYVAVDTSGPFLGKSQLDWLARTMARPFDGPRLVLTHKPFTDPRPHAHHHLEDPHDRERLIEILARTPRVTYYCGHIEGHGEYEASGVPVRIVGSLTFPTAFESDYPASNGFVDLSIDAAGSSIDQKRVELEPAGWHETAAWYALRVGPRYLASNPTLAVGLALVVLASAPAVWRAWRWLRERRAERKAAATRG